MSRRPRLPALPVLALAGLALVGAVAPTGARAEDAPPAAAPAGPPPARAKLSHPFLDAVVGSWDLTLTAGGQTMKGQHRFWPILDGTALADELVVGEGEHEFFGFGIVMLGADGRSVKHWWFDSMGQGGVQEGVGTVTADVLETSAEGGGVKTTDRFVKTAEGFQFTMTVNGEKAVEAVYRKAATPHGASPVREASAPKCPFVGALLGDWTVKGTYRMGTQAFDHAGTSSWRHVVGGAYLLQTYEIESAVEHSWAYGVSSVGDGKAMKTWWFSNVGDGPVVVEGPLEGDAWKGAAKAGPFGPFTLTLTRKDATFVLDAAFPAAGVTGTETFTKK